MRDYAKRTSRSVRRNHDSNGSWILVLLALCTLLFAGYIAYHFLHERTRNTIKGIPVATKPSTHSIAIKEKPIKKIKKKPIVKKIKKHAAIALNPADIQPRYDFYKLLPEMKVIIPEKNV